MDFRSWARISGYFPYGLIDADAENSEFRASFGGPAAVQGCRPAACSGFTAGCTSWL